MPEVTKIAVIKYPVSKKAFWDSDKTSAALLCPMDRHSGFGTVARRRINVDKSGSQFW